jgi:hypothetical protein
MTLHDDWDEGSELSELRELHRQDRMPADVRERLMRHVRAPSSMAIESAAAADAVWTERQARPSWPPSPANHGMEEPWAEARAGSKANDPEVVDPERADPKGGAQRGGAQRGARSRRVVYALGAGALAVAAAMALSIGAPSPHVGVEPERATREPEVAHEPVRSSGNPNNAEMRVVGWLIPGSVKRVAEPSPELGATCRYGFRLSPLSTASNAVLRVEYGHCPLPEALLGGRGGCVKVTADGYLGDDGHLEASRVSAEDVHCQP